MKEAKDHCRITPEGLEMGKFIVRATEPCIEQLNQEGEPDERCKTCAFRLGTVPNGCLQTQLDALKAVLENVPFMCHQKKNNVCYGWYAARQAPAVKGKIKKVPWKFSPPEE